MGLLIKSLGNPALHIDNISIKLIKPYKYEPSILLKDKWSCKLLLLLVKAYLIKTRLVFENWYRLLMFFNFTQLAVWLSGLVIW